MFTGIIEEIGIVSSAIKTTSSIKLTIEAKKIIEDIHLGDSIAVNGICLTVTEFSTSSFTSDVMHETINRTSLKNIKQGTKVNLERAMLANNRFGGHIVSGHIDGIGTIINIKRDNIAIWFTIKANEKIMQYIIEKGSIAIDGISLTVADLTKDSFRVSVIPHTLKNTILSNKNINDTVNLENDCIGKYIKKFVSDQSIYSSKINREFLLKYGY